MNIKDVQKNHYFEYRNIDEAFYKNYTLPQWIKNEIKNNKNLKILDYGCGFGQLLDALKNNGYTKIYGIDIEKKRLSGV